MPSRKNVHARPDNKALQARMKKCMAAGMMVQEACALSGIALPTHYRWMRLARDGDEKYQEYAEAIQQGLARGEQVALAAVQRAFTRTDKQSWQAAAWLLERRYGYTVSNASLPVGDEEDGSDAPQTQDELIQRLAAKLPVHILRAALDRSEHQKKGNDEDE